MGRDMCAGAGAQLVGGLIFTPLDIIKERMQVKRGGGGGKGRQSTDFDWKSGDCGHNKISKMYAACVLVPALHKATTG
jgi:hypothetical protein